MSARAQGDYRDAFTVFPSVIAELKQHPKACWRREGVIRGTIFESRVRTSEDWTNYINTWTHGENTQSLKLGQSKGETYIYVYDRRIGMPRLSKWRRIPCPEDSHETGPQPPLWQPPPWLPQQPGITPGPTIKLGGEVGWGGSRNGFEDYKFSGSGVIGGQVDFPIGAYTGELGNGAYTGFGVSVLGSGVSGSKPDPITSNIRLLVPIDGILGMTFAPNGGRWPLSLYGFGGLAIGDVNVSASPFSATQTMGGWSIGVGADLQLSPNWSVGLKYRHFDLGNATFSVFPGGTSFVSERGDMVTGTLSYRFPVGGTRTRLANGHEIATPPTSCCICLPQKLAQGGRQCRFAAMPPCRFATQRQIAIDF